MKQPEALRLAVQLEREWINDALNYDTAQDAWTELRRLHSLNQELVEALKFARDALTFTPTLSPAVEELCDDAIQLSNKVLAQASGSATQTGETE